MESEKVTMYIYTMYSPVGAGSNKQADWFEIVLNSYLTQDGRIISGEGLDLTG
jgi:hypothetical protein